MNTHIEAGSAGRQIFANRTLNLRSIQAVGYDMDYTLIHYNVEAWERHAYDSLRQLAAEDGWPVEGLEFDPGFVTRGLVVDTELGNIVKANRFGYVMRVAHGTRLMDFEEQRAVYQHVPVDLGASRFVFLNTLFALSGCCLYAQLVDLLDQHRLPELHGYQDLFRRIDSLSDQAHVEGSMKAQITADPSSFIELDPDSALALEDQRRAGKRLMLITNSDWPYVRDAMSFAFDRYLPEGSSWRDLFELVIVSARKPDFFSRELPLFAVVDEDRGLLQPVPGPIPGPGVYLGGDATRVEEYLKLSGAEILYVGDHIFADVRMSKSLLRWRTALILRELEDELEALEGFRAREAELVELMGAKEKLEVEQRDLRLQLQRLDQEYGPQPSGGRKSIEARLAELRSDIEDVDGRVVPLARAAGEASNPTWGLLLRAGNDKSHLARQLEQSADIYTSRVSNFLRVTPFAYLRATRGSMPHDRS
jgi:HAD superfamily 5'-nucleotidase-like hydrolase